MVIKADSNFHTITGKSVVVHDDLAYRGLPGKVEGVA